MKVPDLEREEVIIDQSPSDIYFGSHILEDDSVLSFINKVEPLTYKHVVERLKRKGYNGRTPVIFPQLYEDKFEVFNFKLDDIKDKKEGVYYKDRNEYGFPSNYLSHTLPMAKFKNYQKYSGFSLVNNTHHRLIEVDILTGRREEIKQSLGSHNGQLLFNFSEMDYSEKIECNDEEYTKKVGHCHYQVDMRTILNDDKFLYVPELGKIYHSDRIKDDFIVNDLIARINDSINLQFFHDTTMDCKFAISCQDSYGFVSELYAVVDDEIINVNVYNASGINTLFAEISTNDVFLDLEQHKKEMKNDNSNIWITKMVLNKETGKYEHTHESHLISNEDYKKDVFTIDNIPFSSSFETLKAHNEKNKKNLEKTTEELEQTKKEFDRLKESYNKEIGDKKSFQSFNELIENLRKKNNFLNKFINYIDSKYPKLCSEIKKEFLDIETDDKDVIKKNLKTMEYMLAKDKDELKHEYEMKLRKAKKKAEKQQHRRKMKLADEESQHKISMRNFDYKIKKKEVKSKSFGGKVDIFKTVGGIIKSIVPLVMGGLALFFGIGKMRA